MTTGPADKKEQAREFFGRHAAAYAESSSFRGGADLNRLIDLLDLQPHERALDVATAAGHTAFALAARVREVVGLDLTPAMRVEFEKGAAESGVRNASFHVGDVEAMPFEDGSFDIVTSRRAPHHFPDVPAALREMRRVLKPGGRLGIADMTAPTPPAVHFMNRLDTARDSSHVRAFTPDEWHELLTSAGFQVAAAEVLEEPISWEAWLRPVSVDSAEAEEAERILAKADPDVARDVVLDGPEHRLFIKRRIVLVARKPPAGEPL